MNYIEDQEKAAEITRMVLQTLSRLTIPTNPINFSLWYEYYLGSSDDLNDELNAIMNDIQRYTNKKAKELFLLYIINQGAKKMEKICGDMQRILTNSSSVFEDAGKDINTYEDLLGQSKDKFGENHSLTDVNKVISSLIAGTQVMIETNKRYEQQLHESTKEVKNLRQELSDIRVKASQDPLTGLANRTTFDNDLDKALKTAEHERSDLCLMMIDIDHFKRINDKHGHIVGDKVLKFIANTFKKMVKGKDIVSRYGGEEFCILLEDTPIEGALTLAEKIRTTVEKTKIKRVDTNESLGTITISIGIDRSQAGDNTEDFLERTDQALYYSKNNGRNKVTVFSDIR